VWPCLPLLLQVANMFDQWDGLVCFKKKSLIKCFLTDLSVFWVESPCYAMYLTCKCGSVVLVFNWCMQWTWPRMHIYCWWFFDVKQEPWNIITKSSYFNGLRVFRWLIVSLSSKFTTSFETVDWFPSCTSGPRRYSCFYACVIICGNTWQKILVIVYRKEIIRVQIT